jgi:Clostripain family
MSGSTPNWTIAVHLAGGKGLTEQMVRALQDMRDEASHEQNHFRILAQFEPQGKLPRAFAFDLDDAPSHFALPFKPSSRRPIPSALVNYEYVLDATRLPSVPLSSVQLLASFVKSGKSASSGGPFMLVISGHGNGAVGPFLAFRGPGEDLSLQDLPAVFDAAGLSPRDKIDILGMDCCAMSMIEVGFELSPYARFLVASEGDISNHGWPYRHILRRPPARSSASSRASTTTTACWASPPIAPRSTYRRWRR